MYTRTVADAKFCLWFTYKCMLCTYGFLGPYCIACFPYLPGTAWHQEEKCCPTNATFCWRRREWIVGVLKISSTWEGTNDKKFLLCEMGSNNMLVISYFIIYGLTINKVCWYEINGLRKMMRLRLLNWRSIAVWRYFTLWLHSLIDLDNLTSNSS